MTINCEGCPLFSGEASECRALPTWTKIADPSAHYCGFHPKIGSGKRTNISNKRPPPSRDSLIAGDCDKWPLNKPNTACVVRGLLDVLGDAKAEASGGAAIYLADTRWTTPPIVEALKDGTAPSVIARAMEGWMHLAFWRNNPPTPKKCIEQR